MYLSAHYRHPLNFTLESLQAARQAMGRLTRFENALAEKAGISEPPSYDTARKVEAAGDFQPAFEALCRDLNTPEALGKIFTTIKGIHVDQLSAERATELYHQYHFVLAALGLVLGNAHDQGDEIPEEIRSIAEDRWQARTAKDWAESDRLRDLLADSGWLVQDGKEGYTVTHK